MMEKASVPYWGAGQSFIKASTVAPSVYFKAFVDKTLIIIIKVSVKILSLETILSTHTHTHRHLHTHYTN